MTSRITHYALRVTLFFFLLSFNFSLADQLFKDMPEKHWAEPAVYDMVKLGVTSGFPDGTFRGMKKMNREEIAGFLSNLYPKIEDAAKTNRLLHELQTEFAVTKYRYENPDGFWLNTEFSERIFYGNLLNSNPNKGLRGIIE